MMKRFEQIVIFVMALLATNVFAMEDGTPGYFAFTGNVIKKAGQLLNLIVPNSEDRELDEWSSDEFEKANEPEKPTGLDTTQSETSSQDSPNKSDDTEKNRSLNRFDDTACLAPSLVITGVLEDTYKSFLTIDRAILRSMRTDIKYGHDWRSAQRQCAHIIYWAYALNGKKIPDFDLDINDPTLRFAQYAVPSKLCEVLDKRLPNEELVPSCLQFDALDEEGAIKIVLNHLKERKPILAFRSANSGKPQLALSAIIGIKEDPVDDLLLVITTTSNATFLEIKPISTFIEIINLTSITSFISEEVTYRLKSVEREWRPLAIELEKNLKTFNFIVFGAKPNQSK